MNTDGQHASTDDLIDRAEHINFLISTWHDFGYENPPTPESAAIPPLGKRSAAAITGGHDAVEKIDELSRVLYKLREQLVTELRQDEDIRMARPLP